MPQEVVVATPSVNQPKLGKPTLVKVITETLLANSQKIYQVVGDHLFLYSSTNSNNGALTFSFDDQNAQGILVGQVVEAPEAFKTCQVANTTGGSITYTIIIANGSIDFKGFVVSNTVNVIDAAAEASLATLVASLATELVNTTVLQQFLQGTLGAQVVKDSGASSVSATSTIYTVPGGKSLMITSAWITQSRSTAAGGCGLQIFTGASSYVNSIINSLCDSSIGNTGAISLNNPIVVPTGYLIKAVAIAGTPLFSTGFVGYIQ